MRTNRPNDGPHMHNYRPAVCIPGQHPGRSSTSSGRPETSHHLPWPARPWPCSGSAIQNKLSERFCFCLTRSPARVTKARLCLSQIRLIWRRSGPGTCLSEQDAPESGSASSKGGTSSTSSGEDMRIAKAIHLARALPRRAGRIDARVSWSLSVLRESRGWSAFAVLPATRTSISRP